MIMLQLSRLARGLGVFTMFALLATLLPLSAAAQTDELPPKERRTITVEGTGTVELDPDTADVMLGVVTENESLEEAQDENSTRAQQVIDTLMAAEIAEEDIATTGYSVNPVPEHDRNGNYIGIQRYEVWNQITVTIRDLS